MNENVLLELKNLTTVFPTQRGLITAVNWVNLRLAAGEILGIVGESGCGKSTLLHSILRLISRPGQIVEGEIRFRGQDLRTVSEEAMRVLRGKAIAMIFQDPLSTLNPVFPIGEQIREALRLHGLIQPGSFDWPWPLDAVRRARERQRVLEVMAEVGIPAPEERYWDYPHEFSGGMQQRVLIAIGLACQPAVLLADEPTTALDVTVQAQIMDLMRQINRVHDTSIILVTHNLGLAAEFCHTIAVMYAGRIVERGPVDQVIEQPRHPYTQGLLACIPRIPQRAEGSALVQRQKIRPIVGNVPDLVDLPAGCAFAPRCPLVSLACWSTDLRLRAVTPGHYARCILYEAGERYTAEVDTAVESQRQ